MESISLTSIVIVTSASLLALNLFKFVSWWIKLRHIDGPTPLPIVGTLLMKHATKTSRFIHETKKKFGKTFMYWPGATNPMIVILDPAHVRQVLTDVHIWVKGHDYEKIFSVMMGKGLVTSDRTKHRADRKMFARFFVRGHIEKFMPLMNKQANETIERHFDNKSNEEPKGMDISKVWLEFTCCTFTSFSISKDLNATQKTREFCSFIHQFIVYGLGMVGECIILGLPIHSWINPKRRHFNKADKKLAIYLREITDERKALRSATPEEEPDDILKVMLDANLSEKDLRDHLVTMLAAGVDTTAWTLSYTCYLLASNPDAQRKLRKEIKDVMGNRTEVTPNDLKELKYLSMCVKETMRYQGIVPFLTRTATKDVVLKSNNDRSDKSGDVFVPKGASVLISISVLHRNEEQWKDPTKYIPERFENIGDQSVQKGYIPFSYGSRTCIGNSFAVIEASIALTHLLSKYSIEKVPGWKPKPALGITMHERNGMYVRLVREES